jgi:hypothetical protein
MFHYMYFTVVYVIITSESQIHTIPTKMMRRFTRRCSVATGCATFHVHVLISVAVAVTSEFSAAAIFIL